MSADFRARCHSFALYGVVGGRLLSSWAELGTVGAGTTTGANVKESVRISAAARPLPFATELFAVSSAEEATSNVFCISVVFLVPCCEGSAARDVVAVPAQADRADGEKDDGGGLVPKGP